MAEEKINWMQNNNAPEKSSDTKKLTKQRRKTNKKTMVEIVEKNGRDELTRQPKKLKVKFSVNLNCT